MDNQKVLISIVIAVLVLGTLGYLIFRSPAYPTEAAITNFEECIAAGYPAMESYPQQCRTESGETFVEDITEGENPSVAGRCYVGGCSGQICSDQPGALSTCEYREEYACYKTATCERQGGGECGWTMTPALNICLGASTGVNLK